MGAQLSHGGDVPGQEADVGGHGDAAAHGVDVAQGQEIGVLCVLHLVGAQLWLGEVELDGDGCLGGAVQSEVMRIDED